MAIRNFACAKGNAFQHRHQAKGMLESAAEQEREAEAWAGEIEALGIPKDQIEELIRSCHSPLDRKSDWHIIGDCSSHSFRENLDELLKKDGFLESI